MATTGKALITAEQFMQMDLDDGNFELVRGEVIKLPTGMPEHGLICADIGFTLAIFSRETGLGYVLTNDTAVQTEHDPDTVRGVDVCYYSQARWPRSEVGMSLPPVPPDLAVEVASPSDRPAWILEKASEYLDVGVPMVWVVYPKSRTLLIYRCDSPEPMILAESDTIENFPELPGFRCTIAEFFI